MDAAATAEVERLLDERLQVLRKLTELSEEAEQVQQKASRYSRQIARLTEAARRFGPALAIAGASIPFPDASRGGPAAGVDVLLEAQTLAAVDLAAIRDPLALTSLTERLRRAEKAVTAMAAHRARAAATASASAAAAAADALRSELRTLEGEYASLKSAHDATSAAAASAAADA